MNPHIVIVGGGVTGMAAAYAVASDPRSGAMGARCTLVEQEARLGGKLLTERIDGCLVEAGPDSFLSTKPWAAELCRKIGLGDRLIGTVPGKAVYVAYRSRLYPLPEGLALGVPSRFLPLWRSGLLSPLEKLRVALDLVLPRRTDDSDESIGSFIRRRLGEAAVTRLAGPLLAGIHAGNVDDLSVRATFPQLREWEATHRSLVLAAIARRRQATGRGKRHAPMFLSLIGGVGEMVDRLAASLGDTTVISGRRAVEVSRRESHDGRPGYAISLEGGHTLCADAVLLATPASVTAGLVAPLCTPAAQGLRQIASVSTVAVTMAFRRDEVSHPLGGHGFIVARGEPLSITACTWVSSKWPHRAPPGLVLLRCYLGSSGREAVVEEEDTRIGELVRADLRTTVGISTDPVFTSITRWRESMPQYRPGHLDRIAAIEAELAPLPGLALAGSSYRGVGIPDCIRQGTEAAGRLVGSLSRGVNRT